MANCDHKVCHVYLSNRIGECTCERCDKEISLGTYINSLIDRLLELEEKLSVEAKREGDDMSEEGSLVDPERLRQEKGIDKEGL